MLMHKIYLAQFAINNTRRALKIHSIVRSTVRDGHTTTRCDDESFNRLYYVITLYDSELSDIGRIG